MIDILTMLAVLCAGLFLGGFFFGGLLWTVERGLRSKQPALWFLGSWLIRITVILGSFYLLSAGQWHRMLICVSGFFIARIMVTRYTGDMKKTRDCRKEVGDAT